jgi:hypothetical protein
MTKEKRPSGITLMAVGVFYKIKKLEDKIEKQQEELSRLVAEIPSEEMGYYVDQTTIREAMGEGGVV